jgi:hypothetical protein
MRNCSKILNFIFLKHDGLVKSPKNQVLIHINALILLTAFFEIRTFYRFIKTYSFQNMIAGQQWVTLR